MKISALNWECTMTAIGLYHKTLWLVLNISTLMVEMFIKHVLGVETDHPGLYGHTTGYYGAVEQQGRLTLHLHLLYLKGCLTPQEIKDNVMDPTSDF
jgi:hypothetical protein